MLGCSDYGWTGRNPKELRTLLMNADKQFAKVIKKHEFDAIAFTGSSGACLAFPLALRYNLPLIYVRKPGERSHGVPIEYNGNTQPKNYIIVDDFVESGKTVGRIVDKIKKQSPMAHCVGIFLYSSSRDHDVWTKAQGYIPIL